MRRFFLLSVFALGCSSSDAAFDVTPDTGAGGDTSAGDTSRLDTGAADSSAGDTKKDDAADTTVTDSGGATETGTTDTGATADTGTTPDTGTPDTGTPDTGTPDTGTPDTGTPDTGTPDTGPGDTGTDGATCPAPPSTVKFDASFMSCSELQSEYPKAVLAAKACGCDKDCTTDTICDSICCNCSVFVSRGSDGYPRAAAIYAEWTKRVTAGTCKPPICPLFVCPKPSPGGCSAGACVTK